MDRFKQILDADYDENLAKEFYNFYCDVFLDDDEIYALTNVLFDNNHLHRLKMFIYYTDDDPINRSISIEVPYNKVLSEPLFNNDINGIIKIHENIKGKHGYGLYLENYLWMLHEIFIDTKISMDMANKIIKMMFDTSYSEVGILLYYLKNPQHMKDKRVRSYLTNYNNILTNLIMQEKKIRGLDS